MDFIDTNNSSSTTLDSYAFTLCREFTGNITISGKNVHITFVGADPQLYEATFLQALRLALFDFYKSKRKKISTSSQQICFYLSLRHEDTEYGVQCILKKNTFRLFIYPPSQGLPSLFRDQEKIQADAEKQRIRSLLEHGLILEDVFILYYQPIIEIDQLGAARAIKGAEAFLRVKDNGELFNPKNYLDVAEEDPLLMRKLGYKILELACSDLKVFKTKYPLFTISLNVSEQQFARFDDAISFESIFASIKEQYAIERHDIALEIAEVTVDANTDSAGMLKRLFDDGTPIILDNFTIGALLKDPVVEIDIYKVSGQMLHDSCYGNDSQKYVARDFLQRVFGAARQYGKSVVVKGVESLDQIPPLLELGYAPDTDLVQGYAYCPPMDLASFEMIYKENVTRLYRSHLVDLFRHAHVRVLYQKSDMLINICSYFQRKRLTSNIAVAQSLSELWSTKDRNLVVIMGYDFISYVVSPDQLKDTEHADETWKKLLANDSLFEIPGLPMALINNFQDKDSIAELFELVEEYDGHNLYQILIAINREKTEKIPFIILSENDTHMQHVEENVLILNGLNNLDQFEDTFINSIIEHPEAIGKFNRL